MKKYSVYLAVCIFLVLSAVSCGPSSKELYSNGLQLDMAGDPEGAVEYYIRALKKDRENLDARAGLKKTGQAVLEKKLEDFRTYAGKEEYESAYNAFLAIRAFTGRISAAGVELNVPAGDEVLFKQTRTEVATIYYNKALDLAKSENYNAAIDLFESIDEIERNFKDTDSQIARCYYLLGKRYFDDQQFIEAYEAFGNCIEYDDSYKDADLMKGRALKNGKVTVGVFPFRNDNRQQTYYRTLVPLTEGYSTLFYEFVGGTVLEELLRSKNYPSYRAPDRDEALKIARELGFKAVILGRIVDIDDTGSNTHSSEERAYEPYTVKDADGKSATRYREVFYTLTTGERSIRLAVQYTYIYVPAERIVMSEILKTRVHDRIEFADYAKDNYRKLKVKTSSGKMRDIDAGLFRGRRELKSRENLLDIAESRSAKEVAALIWEDVSE